MCGDNDLVGREAMRKVRRQLQPGGVPWPLPYPITGWKRTNNHSRLSVTDLSGRGPEKGSIADLHAKDLKALIRLELLDRDESWQKPGRNRAMYQQYKCPRPKRNIKSAGDVSGIWGLVPCGNTATCKLCGEWENYLGSCPEAVNWILFPACFGRIQRLCQHLDRLISRTDQEKNRKKRRNMRKAQARMRQKLINLVDELHWQCARWLTSNYRVILLPKFETQSMTRRGERQIQSKTARKTARMMLSFQHYRFKKRLQWKAWQRGSLVLEVNEAYTSRTRSWDGRVDEKLGGSRTIRDESGFIMDRDINGARGIFLRALGDSPFLRELLTRVASPQTSTLLNIC